MLNPSERGSATVESVFAIVALMLLTLGALQVGFVLYARNVLISAAHEGARAAVERGARPEDAQVLASAVVERAAGGLVSGLRVAAGVVPQGDAEVVRVRVEGAIDAFGPVPVSIPVSATATSVREAR